MSELSGVWVVVSLVAGLAALVLIQRRHVHQVRADRGRLFEECEDLLDDPVVVRRGLDFPLLHGRRRGHDVRIEPVIDTLSMRTLPVLWLVVSVRGPHDVPGRLSVLARACGTEFYARHGDVGEPVRTGPEWPAELSVRWSPGGAPAAPAALLDRVRDVMADGSVKQVMLGPTLARMVWKCATGESGTYRVTRRVDLTQVRADRAALGALLDTVDELLEVAAPASDSAGSYGGAW